MGHLAAVLYCAQQLSVAAKVVRWQRVDSREVLQLLSLPRDSLTQLSSVGQFALLDKRRAESQTRREHSFQMAFLLQVVSVHRCQDNVHVVVRGAFCKRFFALNLLPLCAQLFLCNSLETVCGFFFCFVLRFFFCFLVVVFEVLFFQIFSALQHLEVTVHHKVEEGKRKSEDSQSVLRLTESHLLNHDPSN